MRDDSISPSLSLSCSMGSLPVGVHDNDIFTKWLQYLLSITSPCRVQISLLHQSTRSSVHLLLGLHLLFLPRIMPKTACFRSLSSCILHMWPKQFNFLSIILWTILMLVPVLFTISVFLIFCCQFTFNNLLRAFRFESPGSVHVPFLQCPCLSCIQQDAHYTYG